jgi:hypothetical protein
MISNSYLAILIIFFLFYLSNSYEPFYINIPTRNRYYIGDVRGYPFPWYYRFPRYYYDVDGSIYLL